MPLKNWLRLQQLSASLTPQEKNYFKAILQVSGGPGPSKILSLFYSFEGPMGTAAPQLSDKDRKLLHLLEDRIVDNLLMDVNLLRNRKGQLKNEGLVVHKSFLKSKILKERGIIRRASQIAGACAEKAIALEDYGLALRFQLSMVSLHRFEKDFHSLLARIDFYEYCNNLKNKAVRLYKELQLKKFLGLTENLDLFVRQNLEVLVHLEKKHKCNTLRYIRLYFQKEQLEMQGIPQQALHVLTHLYKMCSLSIDCQLVHNLHELVYEQARLSFEMGNVSIARYFLAKSIEQLPDECASCQNSRFLLFLIDYTEGRFEGCQSQVKEIHQGPYFRELMPTAHKVKWHFYHSCLLFSMGQYERCLQKVDETYLLGKPSGPMNLKLRFLKLMCLVSLEKLDRADRETESLRKFISRNRLKPVLTDLGLEAFLEMLLKLKYFGYVHGALEAKGISLAEIRDELHTYLRDKPLSYRMVPYQAWLDERIAPAFRKPLYYNKDIHEYRREQHLKSGKMKRLLA